MEEAVIAITIAVYVKVTGAYSEAPSHLVFGKASSRLCPIWTSRDVRIQFGHLFGLFTRESHFFTPTTHTTLLSSVVVVS